MKWGALRICIFYIVLSVIWITLSDKILFLFEGQLSKSAILLLNSGKGYFFVLLTGLVIYKLIRTEEIRLKDSERKYRTMYEANPLPMWIYDLETLKITSVNSAAIKHYGFSEEAFLKKTILDIRPTQDIPGVIEAAGDVPMHAVKSSVWVHYQADGTPIHVNINSQKLIIDNKPYVMVIAKDITEKVLYEKTLKILNQNLKEERDRLTDTQKLAMLAGWILYLDNRKLEWSEEVYRITDHTPQPDEDLFDVYVEHIYPEDRASMKEALDLLVKTGKKFDVTHRIKLHDGRTRYIHHVARLEYDDGKPYRVIGSMQDITSQREKEIKIEQQYKAMQEIAWVNSHEIRGPVVSILGLFNLYKDTQKIEERENIIDMINTCAINLDKMVKNVAGRIETELDKMN